MPRIDFPGGDVIATVAALRSLADNLERMTVFRPGERELSNAPMLENWATRHRTVPALVGIVRGHPRLKDGPIITSEIYAIDQLAGWARTYSRFYRLDLPLEEQRSDPVAAGG